MGRRAALAGGLVALACLGIALGHADLAGSARALAALDPWMLLLPLAVFLANVALRARRWEMIFPADRRPGFRSCLSMLGIGNMLNCLLPGRAGDLARCVLVGRERALTDGTRALGTLGVEKVLDGMALATMLVLAAWALAPPRWMVHLLWSSAGLFGVALAGMILLRRRTGALLAVLDRVPEGSRAGRLARRLRAPISSFAEGLAAISSPGQMARLALMTALVWATEAALIWGLALAFDVDVTMRSAVVVSAACGLAMMAPAAPGAVGTYELAGAAALRLVGVGAGAALALTVAVHAWIFVTNTALGLSILGVRGMRLAELRAGLEEHQVTI